MIKKLQLNEMAQIAPLFDGWQETMIWSCLQGHMGYGLADEDDPSRAAQLVVGDMCFFAGQPDDELIKRAGAFIVIPENENWCSAVERVLKTEVFRISRYSVKKEPEVFDCQKLQSFAGSIPTGYELKMIDGPLYEAVMERDWSRDLCAQFHDYEDYHRRGIGFVVLKDKVPVAGASSYTIYDGGIEIEIDTKEEYRGLGLATVCGAALILECLKRGLYPSWDAHDLRSVSLAEKLGYHRDKEYPAYIYENCVKG